MATTAKKNLLSRFAHFAGLSADDAPATDVDKVNDKVDDLADDQDDTKDDVSDHEERISACESRLDALEADDSDNDGDADSDGANASADDDQVDDYGKKSKAFKAGVQAERTRAAAIFSDPSASTNPVLAAELAFNSGMSATKAVRLLKASTVAPPVAKPSLASRMAGVKPIHIVAEAEATTETKPHQRLAAAAATLVGK
jgi:hypothetical protein